MSLFDVTWDTLNILFFTLYGSSLYFHFKYQECNKPSRDNSGLQQYHLNANCIEKTS